MGQQHASRSHHTCHDGAAESTKQYESQKPWFVANTMLQQILQVVSMLLWLFSTLKCTLKYTHHQGGNSITLFLRLKVIAFLHHQELEKHWAETNTWGRKYHEDNAHSHISDREQDLHHFVGSYFLTFVLADYDQRNRAVAGKHHRKD